jgi:hypothetical protein
VTSVGFIISYLWNPHQKVVNLKVFVILVTIWRSQMVPRSFCITVTLLPRCLQGGKKKVMVIQSLWIHELFQFSQNDPCPTFPVTSGLLRNSIRLGVKFNLLSSHPLRVIKKKKKSWSKRTPYPASFLLTVLGFELRASCLLVRLSTTWATLPALFYVLFLK